MRLTKYTTTIHIGGFYFMTDRMIGYGWFNGKLNKTYRMGGERIDYHESFSYLNGNWLNNDKNFYI